MFKPTQTRNIKKLLTDREIAEESRKQNEYLRKAQEKKEELKSYTKRQNSEIEKLQIEASMYGQNCMSGYIFEERAVYVRNNWEAGQREYYDAITGLVIDSEPIPAGEIKSYANRQVDLDEVEAVKVVEGVEGDALAFFEAKLKQYLEGSELTLFTVAYVEEWVITSSVRRQWIVWFIDKEYNLATLTEEVDFDLAYDVVSAFFVKFMDRLPLTVAKIANELTCEKSDDTEASKGKNESSRDIDAFENRQDKASEAKSEDQDGDEAKEDSPEVGDVQVAGNDDSSNQRSEIGVPLPSFDSELFPDNLDSDSASDEQKPEKPAKKKKKAKPEDTSADSPESDI